MLALLTTTFAILITYVTENKSLSWAKSFLDSSYFGVASVVMVVLPAIGGITAQILNRFQYGSMWGSMRVTKQKIESEMLRFRTSTGDYKPAGAIKIQSTEDDDDDEEETAKHEPPEEPRKIFSRKVSALYHDLATHGLKDTSMEPSEGTSLIHKDLAMKGKKTSASEIAKGDIEKGYATFEGMSDDLAKHWYSKLDGEEYFKQRLLKTLEDFHHEAPPLAAKLRLYEIMMLFCALVSTLLAAMKMTLWIPIPIAIGASLASFLVFEGLKNRVAALNTSIGELTSFATKWASLAIYEKRTVAIKEEMVDLVENAWQRHTAAFVSGSGYMGDDKAGKGKASADGKDGKPAAKGKNNKKASS
jgi:hypothetical protein